MSRWLTAAVAAGLVAVSCGGSKSPTNPTPPPPGGGGNPTPTNMVTISANAVSPKDIVVSPGTRVQFFNNDNRPHEMNTDPHPDHTGPTACTEINQVGFLSPGQTKETGNLNTVRTCSYHDHNQSSNTALQGTITIR